MGWGVVRINFIGWGSFLFLRTKAKQQIIQLKLVLFPVSGMLGVGYERRRQQIGEGGGGLCKEKGQMSPGSISWT